LSFETQKSQKIYYVTKELYEENSYKEI